MYSRGLQGSLRLSKMDLMQVRHDVLTVPMESHLALIFALINAHVEKEPNFKVYIETHSLG